MNVLKNGKSEDQSQDIAKTSSLPTLLITIVRNIVKSDLVSSCADLMADLLYTAALLSKTNYTKEIGIEPIYSKHLVPMFSQLLTCSNSKVVQLSVVKCLGIFVC